MVRCMGDLRLPPRAGRQRGGRPGPTMPQRLRPCPARGALPCFSAGRGAACAPPCACRCSAGQGEAGLRPAAWRHAGRTGLARARPWAGAGPWADLEAGCAGSVASCPAGCMEAGCRLFMALARRRTRGYTHHGVLCTPRYAGSSCRKDAGISCAGRRNAIWGAGFLRSRASAPAGPSRQGVAQWLRKSRG